MTTKSAVLLSLTSLCLNCTIATANAQQFVSSKLVAPTPFGNVLGVADFNGDGLRDFLAPGSASGTVNVMLQNSNGTFTAKPVTGVSGTQCAAADLNGDGKADFACVAPGPSDGSGPATLTIALGNGNGTFAVKAPINLAGAQGSAYILVSDLNHDGKLDIVTASADGYGDSFIQAFLNTGGGNFGAGVNYSGGVIGGTLFGAADFNGDGFPDLVVENNFEVQILTGNGDGSFTAGFTYDAFPLAVGTGDFNKDGHQDLVVVTQQNGTILLGQGNGNFTTGATLNTEFKYTVGSGQTAQFNQPVPVQVFVGDLNNDGKLDIALTSASDTLSVAVYTGNGNGTFSNPKAFTIGDDFGGDTLARLYQPISAFADFNNDGKIDVIAASFEAGYVLAQGDGSGGFKAPAISQTPNSGSIAKGDFNHDGIEDVAVVNEPLCTTCTTTSVTVFLGTGKNFFQAPVTYTVPVSKAMIAAGDVNNDGHIDLVVARNPFLIGLGTTSTDDVAVLLGRGDGTFEAPVGYHLLGAAKPGTNSQQVYLEDVNKDGKLDLIGDWGVALGKGNGQFGTPIALPSGISGSIVALAPGDFNNTGTIGLAVATNTYDSGLNSYTLPANVYVLAGSSNGSFHIVNTTSLPAYASALTTADMNGDHRTDILYTTDNFNATNPQITLTVALSSTGNYGFTSKSYVLPLGPANDFTNSTIITGDFNRDGNLDVAIPALYQSAGDLAVLLGTGRGSLNGTAQYYQGSIGQAAVLDVNGDGADDIVGTTAIGVARLLNTGAH